MKSSPFRSTLLAMLRRLGSVSVCRVWTGRTHSSSKGLLLRSKLTTPWFSCIATASSRAPQLSMPLFASVKDFRVPTLRLIPSASLYKPSFGAAPPLRFGEDEGEELLLPPYNTPPAFTACAAASTPAGSSAGSFWTSIMRLQPVNPKACRAQSGELSKFPKLTQPRGPICALWLRSTSTTLWFSSNSPHNAAAPRGATQLWLKPSRTRELFFRSERAKSSTPSQ
mmetsp:Transcript_67708/g.136315  ORF Transcript_67708/g.136315 Transcript_67708/m.136315 type:complete len:225 (-) Transcript_67708:499-1173(-)